MVCQGTLESRPRDRPLRLSRVGLGAALLRPGAASGRGASTGGGGGERRGSGGFVGKSGSSGSILNGFFICFKVVPKGFCGARNRF